MPAAQDRAWTKHYGAWTSPTLDYGKFTLLDAYATTLAEKPEKPAVSFFSRRTTYRELNEQVCSAAAGLKSLGVGRGDRVALLLPNCPQHVIAVYAILMLGAEVVEHNPLYTAAELEFPFTDHQAKVAIVWDKAVPVAEKLTSSTPLTTIISVNLMEAMPLVQRLALKLPVPKIKAARDKLHAPEKGTLTWKELVSSQRGGDGKDIVAHPDVTKDDVAFILYTSGTTGRPKGAQLTHGNLYANVLQGKAWIPGLGEEDERLLIALPTFHSYGLTTGVVLSVAVGGEAILLPAPDISLVLSTLAKQRPTFLPAVPTLYEALIRAAQEEGVSLKGVKYALSGAAALPAPTVEKWEKLTGGLLVEGYGLTETSPIITANPMNNDRRPGCIGIPFPDTVIRIVDPHNPGETLPDGEEGELVVRGPQVFKGYLNNPEATEETFHDGWFRTGDMGAMEADGFIRLVSRIKEMIITGGFNVYPEEVEQALREHPAIEDIAVVGLPKEDGSETVVACVIPSDPSTVEGAEFTEEVRAFGHERLTRYKVPREVYVVDELPRNQLGKISRVGVRNDLLERL